MEEVWSTQSINTGCKITAQESRPYNGAVASLGGMGTVPGHTMRG